MKTKNNVRKTALKAAAFLSLGLITTFTGNAQDLIAGITSHSNSEISEILGLENQGSFGNEDYNPVNAASAIIHLETAAENNLTIENWMTEESNFVSQDEMNDSTGESSEKDVAKAKDALYASASAALLPAAEPKLEMEEWMLDENNFKPKKIGEEKTSVERKVELWKVQNNKYGNRKFILTQVNDRKLEIEIWMINNKYW